MAPCNYSLNSSVMTKNQVGNQCRSRGLNNFFPLYLLDISSKKVTCGVVESWTRGQASLTMYILRAPFCYIYQVKTFISVQG